MNKSRILNKRSFAGSFVLLAVAGVIIAANLYGNTFAPAPSVQIASVEYATPRYFDNLNIIASAALVYDIKANDVLFAKNAGKQLPLASITKLMLALVVDEVLDPDTPIVISETALQREGDNGLTVGEIWRSQDLMDFTLIESSNDGAEALAETASLALRAKYIDAPKADAVIWRMNEKAFELSLRQTYFTDVGGLDQSESMASAYGSARDIAELMFHIMKKAPYIISSTARDGVLLESINGGEHEASNTNQSLGKIPGLIGGKTGFTDLAGGNLIVAFDVGLGRPVIAVVLGSTVSGRFSDMESLVEATRKTISLQ